MTNIRSHFKIQLLFLVFLALYFIVDFIGVTIPATREFFISLTPVTVIFSFGILMFFHNGFNRNFWIFVSLILILSFLIEYTAIHISAVFGIHYYGNSLGYKVLGVPLLMSVNSLMLVYCSISAVSRIDLPGQFQLLLSAMIIVAYYFVMELVAPRLDFLYRPSGNAPVLNYFALFIAALFLITLSKTLRINFQNKIAISLLIIQFLFLILLNFSLRIF